jgi:hypothetical protein
MPTMAKPPMTLVRAEELRVAAAERQQFLGALIYTVTGTFMGDAKFDTMMEEYQALVEGAEAEESISEDVDELYYRLAPGSTHGTLDRRHRHMQSVPSGDDSVALPPFFS